MALLMCAITPYNDYYIGATYLSGNFFPIGGVAILLLLTLVINPLVIALGYREKAFRPSEIITCWSLVVVVAGIPSSGLMRYLIPHIAAPIYYANKTNGWGDSIVAHLPSRLIVTDPVAVRDFFEGLNRGDQIPWHAWAIPLGWWSIFVALLFAIYFCLSSIVRKQWVENEHFAFPLVRLPTMMASAPEPGQLMNSFLRNRLLWTAVLLVTALHTVKGMHTLFPNIPDIPTSVNLSKYVTTSPYNAVNEVTFAVYPLVIGFSYLMTSEVCFSLWFFYLVFKAQVLYGAFNSWDMTGPGAGIAMGPSFTIYQEAGGAVMLVIWLLWSMRAHLGEVFAKTFMRHSPIDDSQEPMPHRLALLGLMGAYIGLYIWFTLVADIQPNIAVPILGGTFAIFLMLSWLVAQAGLLFIQQSFSPTQIGANLVTQGSMSIQSLTMASMAEHVAWFDAREFMMPSLLNADKAADDTHLSPRSLTKALAVTVTLAVVVSAVASIWLPYTHGGGTGLKNAWMYTGAPTTIFKWVTSQTQTHAQHVSMIINLAIGALTVLAMFALRSLLPGCPIHPAGFLVAGSFPMALLWCSLLLGWGIKLPILRYGGNRLYQALLPFFMGLVLGDCMNAILWAIIGFVTHTGYSLLPG